MHILLPPSEGKMDAAATGQSLSLPELDFPELTTARERVLHALIKLSEGPRAKALATLSVSARQTDEIDRNLRLFTAPTAPASDIYTGVLFAALDWLTMTAQQRRRANKHVVITSALFGFVRPESRIPAYRLSGSTTLPKLGRVSAFWRAHLRPEMLPDVPVLDLRSTTYAAFLPPTTLAPGSAVVKVWQRDGAGNRTAVTHFSKRTKGEVARCLLTQSRLPRSPSVAAEVLADQGWTVDWVPGSTRQIARIDVVIDA